MRAFVAIELPSESVLNAIEAFQRELSGTGADLKPVSKENLHFTVKFLGDITQEQASEVDRRLRSLSLKSLEVLIRGAGAFPTISHPRVVWVGVSQEDREKIEELATPIIKVLHGIGTEEARGFQPHITLARVRSGRNLRPLASFLLESRARDFGRVTLKAFKLKSSVLTPGGPVYKDEGVYELR